MLNDPFKPKRPRGLANVDPSRLREISRAGGLARHANATPKRLRILYKGTNPKRSVLWSLDFDHPEVLFTTMNATEASAENSRILRLELSGKAKVYFVSKKRFSVEDEIQRARMAGFDAVWFPDQKKVGVAVLNQKMIVDESWIEV